MDPLPLLGAVVGITADRRSEEQAMLLERLGARVLHGPVIRTMPLDDENGLRSATAALIAHPPDVVLLSTSVGVRGWFTAADSLGVGEALRFALRCADVVTRGPKAMGAAVSCGLTVTTRSVSERSAEMVTHVATAHPSGVRVAVQLDGATDATLPDRLRDIGADVVPVPVYRWTRPHDALPARRVVEAVASRRVDAVTFTSSPAVERFIALAEESGLLDEVRASLDGPVVAACVGPACSETARSLGIQELVAPDRARLGPMVEALGRRLSRPDVVRVAGREVALRCSHVVIDGDAVELSGREREVLAVLASRPAAVVSKADLLRDVWGADAADEHTVEVTVARLRRRLGPAGKAVHTVTRRGYRLVPESA